MKQNLPPGLPRLRPFVACSGILLILISLASQGQDLAKTDARYTFRTDFTNSHLPWYQPKLLEFPPHHSDHRVSGELVSADFIHRKGQFRASKTGDLMDFTMPPYGAINYLNAEADLRDVPLGTYFLFFLNQDAHGGFTRLATMQDQFTMDAGHGFSYRLDELRLGEGKLVTTKQSTTKKQPDLGKKELIVNGETRVWKGDKQAKLADLAIGDDLLFNLSGRTGASPGWCTDIWIGAGTHQWATEQQRKKFTEFTRKRGLPGWIDRVEGNQLMVTLFSGDAQNFRKTWMNDFGTDKDLSVVVANDELRTWNPGTDKEKSKLLEIQKTPVDAYGASGVRLVFTVPNMLEGFRKGRIVRVFGSGWPIKDSYYGESLMGYGYSKLQASELMENTPKEYPDMFPFRTDHGNEHLPWFQLKPGKQPPAFSEHLVLGELVKVDSEKRAGQFRTDRTGELVNFAVIPEGSVQYLGAEAALSDIPAGTLCRFNLYQDDKGAFTQASLVRDEFSFLAANAITWRIEALKMDAGKLLVARQIPEAKNYNGDMEKPPDIGRTILLVTPETRAWKGDRQVKLADLAVGDSLLVNLTSEQPGKPSHCTEIWSGAEAQKLATEKQRKKIKTTLK